MSLRRLPALLALLMLIGWPTHHSLPLTGTGQPVLSSSVLGAGMQEDSGIASGREYSAILDELDRPITAGGFVKGAPVVFEDITARTGLDRFVHQAGGPEKQYLIETKSGGIGLFDYDGDGRLDVYVLNAGPWEALFGRAEFGMSRLYRNRGGMTFEDVTESAGVPNLSWGFGVVAADYDSDGDTDLYVSNFGPNRLYRNNGDGTFSDVALSAGVQLAEYMTTGGTFGDYDHDGLLDLFVCGYAQFDPANPPRGGVDVPLNYCRFRGVDVMCGPRGLPGARDFLFHNNGDGTFAEVGEKAGVDDRQGFYGFSPAFVDVDDDGWVDLVVANDSTPNYLYINQRDGTFRDVSYLSGFALNQDGRAQAGMGLGIGDYNLDGRIDFLVAHFSDDYCTLYQNQGDTFFIDVSYESGIASGTIPFVSWGTGFVDYDNDGLEDIFFANGHVYPVVDEHRWGTTWKERPLLFRNQDGKTFQEVPAAPQSGLGIVVVGRGAAFGDLDGDGRVDIVMSCLDDHPRVLQNVSEGQNHWVTVQLGGSGRVPPAGIGSTLILTTGNRTQRGDVFSGGSFASSSDPRVHFGLGEADSIDRLEIRWPDGRKEVHEHLPADQILKFEPAVGPDNVRKK
jgi:hypothetical protein